MSDEINNGEGEGGCMLQTGMSQRQVVRHFNVYQKCCFTNVVFYSNRRNCSTLLYTVVFVLIYNTCSGLKTPKLCPWPCAIKTQHLDPCFLYCHAPARVKKTRKKHSAHAFISEHDCNCGEFFMVLVRKTHSSSVSLNKRTICPWSTRANGLAV
jgi:hypothetical protein